MVARRVSTTWCSFAANTTAWCTKAAFSCEKDDTGEIVFRTELGLVIEQNGYTPPQSPDSVVIDLKKRLEDRFIHAQTCVTGWEGELMDRHLAVGMLCDLDENRPEAFPP